LGASKSITRRQVLDFGGRAAIALAAASVCPRRARAARDNELNIYAWEGYHADSVVEPFAEAFRCDVLSELITSDPEAVNRLRAGESAIWDLVTLNNPWARKVLHPERLIVPLDRDRFEPHHDRMMYRFRAPYHWSVSSDGLSLLGLPQRFGPFSFVVNTDRISRATAEDQGFDLFLDPAMKGRYGILAYDNWNILHICIAAGFSPFRRHSAEEFERFEAVARQLIGDARFLTTDATIINTAIIHGEVDAYFSGGTYTASSVRYDGIERIRGITPARGPIDGKGGIAWTEITSAVANPELSPRAFDFLDYVQQPETAKRVAFAEGTFNPVAQMGDPAVLGHFEDAELSAIQWADLEEDLARCVDYDINPDYEAMLALYNAAKLDRADGRA
jgi:spermidine/putrescine transport system substrate-binding protein